MPIIPTKQDRKVIELQRQLDKERHRANYWRLMWRRLSVFRDGKSITESLENRLEDRFNDGYVPKTGAWKRYLWWRHRY